MRVRHLLPVFAAIVLVWCGGPPELVESQDEIDASTNSLALPCIAPTVIENCALSECHDSVTKQHGMDLSSGDTIYESWVGRKGLDHCTNRVRVRVVPGDPDSSYVMDKIMGTLPCINELSQPMPPPPNAPLTPEEIEQIREWIAGGARLDCSESDPADAGPDVTETDAAVNDSSVDTGGPRMDAATDARRDTFVDYSCTADRPCPSSEVCAGNNCSEPWECILHYVEPVLEHPCSEVVQLYCGCDGTTFEAQSLCPDRPYLHVGVCGEGFTCDPYDVTCDLPAPTCPEGQLPSIVDGCYGECVPLASCRCEYTWECPGHQCNSPETHCEPIPEPDAGGAGGAGGDGP